MKTITIDNIKYKLVPVKSKKKEFVYAKANWGELPENINYDETMTLDGVAYHRHKNGGGWVSEKAQVEETVWVGFFALVKNGVIKDQAIIHDRAVIDCNKLQEGANFNIGGSAQVYGSAWVYDSAQVYDSARVWGKGYLKKSMSDDIELKDWETIE